MAKVKPKTPNIETSTQQISLDMGTVVAPIAATPVTAPVAPIEKSTTTIITKENEQRAAKGVKAVPPLEKASSVEKDTAPQLIVQYVDANGARKVTTYSCASLRISQYRDQNLSKSGMKTTLNVSIEASVIEVN